MSMDEPTKTETEPKRRCMWAILLGELVDGAVRESADQVQVADDWPWSWTRWEVMNIAGRCCFECVEDHDDEHHGKEGDQQWW